MNNMLTLAKLKNLKIRQREDKIIHTLLSTIIGECEQISKNPSEDEILKVIRKMYKDNQETIKVCNDRPEQKSVLEYENKFLSSFLPQPLTEDELYALINSQVAAGLNMPAIMKYLTENYKGRYDGKVAVRICNMLINGTVL